MKYKDILPRVKEIIKVKSSLEDEVSFLTLPEAFDMAAGMRPETGLPVASWEETTKLVNGFRMNEFTILCGSSGIGKTTVLANLAVNFISAGVPTFVASVEVGPFSFVKKMASIIATKARIETEEQWNDVKRNWFSMFFSNPSHILTNYESRVSHYRLMCDILHAYETKGTQICLIDNLNFMMEGGDARQENSKMDQIVHEWIQFVKAINVHVVMVMHPKKTDNGRVESEYDVKGSSSAIQQAQNVLLLNRLKNEKEAPFGYEPKYCRELKIAKCRENGRAVGDGVIFSLDAVSERYSERKLL